MTFVKKHVYNISICTIVNAFHIVCLCHTQVLEGYGSTETTAVASLQYLGDGSAGNNMRTSNSVCNPLPPLLAHMGFTQITFMIWKAVPNWFCVSCKLIIQKPVGDLNKKLYSNICSGVFFFAIFFSKKKQYLSGMV